jgi:hypothetical protein
MTGKQGLMIGRMVVAASTYDIESLEKSLH